MAEVIPAAYPIPKTLDALQESASRAAGVVPLMQLDVVDGRFVKSVSWPYGGHEEEFARMVGERIPLPHADALEYEIDLMVAEPEHVIEDWMHLNPRRIIVHLEATERMENIINDVAAHVTRPADEDMEVVSLGIAISTTTSVDKLEPYIPDIDFVQCMGIAEIGKQGEPFDKRVLSQVRTLRERHPELIISVDGGVHFDTAPRLIAAGVTRLVSGSAVWQSDSIAQAVKRLGAM